MLIRALMLAMLFAPDEGAGGGGAAAGAGAGAGAGAAPPAFADTLPEDIRGEAAFRDIKDVGGLAKSYLAAQRMVGNPNQFVKLPTGPDDADGLNAVFAKLGRPDAPGGYTLKAPDGVKVDDALKGSFADAAHKSGLTPAQAQGLMDWWNTTAAAAGDQVNQARTQAQEKTVAALKQEWGTAYDQKLSLAKQALDHYGGDALQRELDANGLGNSPVLARMLSKLGGQLQEDGVIGKGGGGGGDALSPAEASQQINALYADAAFTKVYTDKNAPGHADAVARMAALHAMKTARAG